MSGNEALLLQVAKAARWARYLEKEHFSGEDAQMERGEANRKLDAIIKEAESQGVL